MIQRNFIIGDNWLYYKIYSGPKTLDRILIDIVSPISKKLISDNIIDKWFYIRYNDPHSHLRVRFHLPNQNDLHKIIKELNPYFKEFVEMNFITDLQVDTYKREIERYGINSIELSEEIFYHSSTMITDFIGMIDEEEDQTLRWLFGLKIIDAFLTNFKLTIEEKLNLLQQLKEAFALEFGMNRFLKQQLDSKYRIHRKDIEEFLIIENNFTYPEIMSLIKINNKGSQVAIDKIIYLKNINRLERSLKSLLSSYIHMHMNRLFKSKMRMNEMVIYDFLYRYYKSIYSRQNKK